MSSRQNAVKAFLDLVSCDDVLDRWIPDEDWVRQIRETGKHDCSIVDLNRGISAQCLWQNNHASIQGLCTIYYNKKSVQVSKSIATKKTISFYYVWELESHLRPSQAIEVSTNRFGTTQRGATAP